MNTVTALSTLDEARAYLISTFRAEAENMADQGYTDETPDHMVLLAAVAVYTDLSAQGLLWDETEQALDIIGDLLDHDLAVLTEFGVPSSLEGWVRMPARVRDSLPSASRERKVALYGTAAVEAGLATEASEDAQRLHFTITVVMANGTARTLHADERSLALDAYAKTLAKGAWSSYSVTCDETHDLIVAA
jgi:hypothetical protein